MPFGTWSDGLGWGALWLSLGVAVAACDGSEVNVGSTATGDPRGAAAASGGGEATSSGGGGASSASGDDSTDGDTCPESAPVEGESCSVQEPLGFLSPGLRCDYNHECFDDECCPYDEYTCEGGEWTYWYVHCDLPPSRDEPEPQPSAPDGGVAWCDFAVDGRPADPCHAWCERRAAAGCPLDSTVESCRDACDATLERTPELGEQCVALHCALMACQATAQGDACDPLGFCQEERSDFGGTCTPTR